MFLVERLTIKASFAALLVMMSCPATMTESVSASARESKAPQAKKYVLHKLRHRTANHSSPDAIVFVHPSFNRKKPVNLIVYNHGLTNTVADAVEIWQLGKHFLEAPPNSVLILPEWAQNPRAYSRNAGPFHNNNFFRNMLSEIMSKTPELKGMKVDDIERIGIVSYSGGFRAARSEILNNGLGAKVKSLTLLDSLYVSDYFDDWLRMNIKQLCSGRMQFHNFFFDTKANSLQQLDRLRKMIAGAKINNPRLIADLHQSRTVMSAKTVSKHGIVYKSSTLSTKRHTPHMNVAQVYFPVVMRAQKMRMQAQSSPQPGIAMVASPAGNGTIR